MSNSKIILIAVILVLAASFFTFDLGQYLSLAYIKNSQAEFSRFYENNMLLTVAIYAAIYIITTALSLPGATILTLAGGALLGLYTGIVVVSFASTIGATLAFLVSRFLLRDLIENKYPDKFKSINEGIKKEGAFYLFALRLVPLFPFFMINILMGLTKMRFGIFFIVSQIGMLPGTFVYVLLGTQLAKIDSLKGLVSPNIILAFTLLGIFPIIAKRIVDFYRNGKILRKYKKPNKFDYNIIVIGGGAAGLVTSYIAAAVKAKVALIEKEKMGGDCLNTGCVPSKALIKSAKMLSYASRAKEFGFKKTKVEFDFKDVMDRVYRIIKEIEPHDSIDRYTRLGVDCITGSAKIIDPYKVEVNGKILTTKNIVIATGAGPLVPKIVGLDNINYLTSDNLWNLKALPKKMVVLGGGPIGCEMAQCFARFGTDITLVEMATNILIREDDEIIEHVKEKFQKEGITILTNHKAKEFKTQNGKKSLICEHNGKDVEIQFDEILLALGRKANINGFGAEQLGVSIRGNGTFEANEFLQTNFPNIYVAGDVTGPYQFTHVAAHQAWYASVNALFAPFKKFKVDYSVIPWATFTDPEVARVGLNEKDAKVQNIPYEVTTYPIDDLDRAIADSENFGIVKVLTQPGKDKILGVTIAGAHAGDLIAEFVLAMKNNIGLNKILGTIHIYPTLAESNKYVAGNWKKNHAPEALLGYIEKFHKWRRNG